MPGSILTMFPVVGAPRVSSPRSGVLEPALVHVLVLVALPGCERKSVEIVMRHGGNARPDCASAAFAQLCGVEFVDEDIVSFRPLHDVRFGHFGDRFNRPVWEMQPLF